MLGYVLYAFFLTLLWCILQNEFSPQNLVVGFIIGLIIVLAVRRVFAGVVISVRSLHPMRILHIINYLLHLFKEIVMANLMVARLVARPRRRIRPGIIALPAEVKGVIQITALGNSITLTPGTITLDVSPEETTLYVHTLDIDDPEEVKKRIKKSLEKYILRAAR